ncbi:hypothetical protein GCM10010124_35790 [Pilimelia terevasa]|uniref:Fibronectin type-III domain-containing protein n=1 Tax=Pilimelia terevasa TaxID=53372 RepID=A0A8J3BQ95_9ACTN|nr:hypothetical protein [Pilimelia terevasa]GGK39960.1 hypothetical protein GCM10010124_35790 [Pilimelia terevasa]
MTGDTPAGPPADGPAALAEADTLVAAGDADGARVVLERLLAEASTPADALVEAADRYAHLLVSAGQPSFACAWARYAGELAAERGGPADPRRLRAAETLAAALHADGRHEAAARQYRAVVAAHLAADGPDAPRTRAAHARLAAVLAEAPAADDAPFAGGFGPLAASAGAPVEYRRPGPRLGRPGRAGVVYAAAALAAVGVGAAAWHLRPAPDRPAPDSRAPDSRAAGSAAPTPTSAGAGAAGTAGAGAGETGAGRPAPPPPSAVRLVDRADSILLTWSYPPGAQGPVLLTGGRRGQPPASLGVLSPGADRYVVHGLRPALAYCFTVAVVYSAEDIAAAPRACTTRRAR